MTLDYGVNVKTPLSQRINFRLILVVAIVALLVGYPTYVLISEQLSGGIHREGQYYETNLKAMGNFEFDGINGTIDDVPTKWRQLDGKKLKLVGQIYPDNSAGPEVHSFQLVYSIQKCCFGGPPKVQERVFCTVPNNGSLPYYGDYSTVKGTLHVKIKKEAGQVVSVYTLDVDSIEPAT